MTGFAPAVALALVSELEDSIDEHPEVDHFGFLRARYQST